MTPEEAATLMAVEPSSTTFNEQLHIVMRMHNDAELTKTINQIYKVN